MSLIRKISIGDDLKNAMHFMVGTEVFSGSKISNILKSEGFYDVYIKSDGEVSKWKSFNSKSISHIEYDTKTNG